MNTTALESGDDLVATMRRVAQDIYDRHSIRDLDALMTQLVAAAVEMVPGATGGGISRTDAGAVRTSHATDRLIGTLDARQAELGEGPCLTAAAASPQEGSILVVDLAGVDARRWPRFAPVAVDLGFRSMLSTHLGTRSGGPHSALNLYARGPHVFDTQARVIAGLFAVQAAALLHGTDEAMRLSRAIDSRDEIGQAKGILMERFTLDDAEAFQLLVRSSQETNVKLVDVARWLVSEARERRKARSIDDG